MLPILYSFRRCPYAIRARFCLAWLEVPVRLREVVLKNKPEPLLALGGRSTVPQLIDCDGKRYEESADIMHFALCQTRHKQRALQLWPSEIRLTHKINAWIDYNDQRFKYWLDRYKYADRYPEFDESYYRNRACVFLSRMNTRLSKQPFLLGEQMSLADIAIFPFIRQFAGVNENWFRDSEYDAVKVWLDGFLNAPIFSTVMVKHNAWQDGQAEIQFP